MHTIRNVVVFDITGDDEEPYQGWTESNPQGYVANVGRIARTKVYVHGASCAHIRSRVVARDGFIGSDYYKVCSLDGQALVQWLEQEHRAGHSGEVHEHSQCHPGVVRISR